MTDHSIIEGQLSIGNIDYYRKYGFLTYPNVLQPQEVKSLNQEVIGIAAGRAGAVQGLTDNPNNLPDELLYTQYAAIHFPHKLSSLIRECAKHPAIVEVLTGIVSVNVKCLQSMFFVKAPGKKGQSWHQDEYFIPTRDRSLTGAWIALDDASEDNGCLWVIPGSHKDGFIRQRITNENDHFADTEVADLSPFEERDFKKVEVNKGSIIFFNGYLLHMSLRNRTTDRFRRALVFHYSSAESMLPWDMDGRIDFTHDNRDIFMVTGKDPYEYKGSQDHAKPFIRPDVLDFNAKGM